MSPLSTIQWVIWGSSCTLVQIILKLRRGRGIIRFFTSPPMLLPIAFVRVEIDMGVTGNDGIGSETMKTVVMDTKRLVG